MDGRHPSGLPPCVLPRAGPWSLIYLKQSSRPCYVGARRTLTKCKLVCKVANRSAGELPSLSKSKWPFVRSLLLGAASVSALADEAITSAKLSALLTEVEGAITAADKAANEARTKALDPTNVDFAAARREMDDTDFRRDRLKAALPKLQRRYQRVWDQECYDRWLAMFEGVKSKHAAAAASTHFSS